MILSLKFYTKVLDLVKQNEFYAYGYMSEFENFKEEFPSKEKIYSSFTGKEKLL